MFFKSIFFYGGSRRMDKKEILIGVRLDREILIKLERYIVQNGLHRYRVKPSQLGTLIIKDWLNNPVLNKRKLLYGRIKNEPRMNRITIKLSEEENIKLYEIYVEKYIRECSSVNVLIYNILLQFLNNKENLSVLEEKKYI
jgi:hypothetical protein